MKYRFRPAQRLHTPNEFAAVLRRRGLIRGVCLELLSVDRGTSGARLGLIVPKRLAKRAVLRNLVKRQVRECFRRVAKELPARDIVVRLARPPQIDSRNLKQILRDDINQLFGKLVTQTTKAGGL